jgi:hypothetical protein
MQSAPTLIVQVPRGGAVDQQLREQPPSAEIIVEAGPTDAEGHLEPPAAGAVVLSVLSPEALVREAEEVRRVIDHAGPGSEPLVVVVEAAEELREDELDAVLQPARHASRAVILRVLRDG